MKNKEITMFELYELLKNDNIPRRIEWNNTIYIYSEVDCQYFDNEYNILTIDISNEYTMGEILYSKTIKILDEENDEFEDIKFEDLWELASWEECTSRGDIIETINQLIRNQKKIIEKVKEYENNK